MRIDGYNVERYTDSKGKAHEVGERNTDINRNWDGYYLFFILANRCGSLFKCLLNLSETEFQINDLICVVKEISRQHDHGL